MTLSAIVLLVAVTALLIAGSVIAGGPIGENFPISNLPEAQTEPAVAYNAQREEYLVVWHNDWPGNDDIYGQRVSKDGQLIGPWFAIAFGAGAERRAPDVAYNSQQGEYLVVWEHDDGTRPNIRGRRVSATGELLDSEIPLATGPALATRVTPAVDYASTAGQYLVAWERHVSGAVSNDIEGQVLSSSGALEGSSLLIAEGTPVMSHGRPDLAYNRSRNEFLVVWERWDGGQHDIRGRRVKLAGGPAPLGDAFAITDWANEETAPAVSAIPQPGGSGQYAVVFVADVCSVGTGTIQGQRVTGEGNLDGIRFGIAGVTSCQGPLPDLNGPAIAGDEGAEQYLAVWTQSTALIANAFVGAQVLPMQGTPADQPPELGGNVADQVAVASGGGGNYLVAFSDQPPLTNDRDIYGQLWGSVAGTPTPTATIPSAPTSTRTPTPTVPIPATPTSTPMPTSTLPPVGTSTRTPTVTATEGLPPTAVATATPTLPAVACENILPHGDFEAGLLPPWGAVGEAGITAPHAHGGSRSIRLGGADNTVGELFAGLDLPPDAVSISLSYWWYVESSDPDPDADVLLVLVGDEGHEDVVETLTNSSPRNMWRQTTVDLSSRSGQFLGITFHAETNEANPTRFYVDDVEVLVCGGEAPGWRGYLPLVRR